MSGGNLNYFYSEMEDHVGDFGDRELDELVKDMANLFYEREWFLSGDTGQGKWVEARDAFKKKWFSSIGRRDRILKYLDDIRDEVLDSFGMSNKYCINCLHWTPEEEEDSPYGECSEHSGCLWHRHETCHQFIARDEGKKEKGM